MKVKLLVIAIFIFAINKPSMKPKNEVNKASVKPKKEVVWNEEQLKKIESYHLEGINAEDQNNIMDLIKNNPWLTSEQATVQYQQEKLSRRLVDELLKLAAPLKFVAAAIFLGNVYSLFKPFVEPFIHRHIGKFIFKNSIQPEKTSITFNDIAGYQSIKKEIRILIKKLKKQKKNGILENIDGALFYGEPGCGKTLFAEAIANQSGVAFFNIKASDLMNEEGNIGDRIKLLFEKVRAYTENSGPCVLLIDEIDLLVANRNNGKLDNNEKVVLQDLLSLLGGPKSLKGVLVIGNTNFKNAIDVALLRNGRLGNHIEFKLPNIDDIKEICYITFKNINLEVDNNFSIDKLAEKLLGYNVAKIIQKIENIKDFIVEHKYPHVINSELINEYEIENSL